MTSSLHALPSICLNMIVKNESHIIQQTLEMLCNAIPFSYWVICDTGSSDNTPELINQFFEKRQIAGELIHHEWKNFAHNRTLALQCAYKKSDWLLVFDADDILNGTFPSLNVLDSNVDAYLLPFGNKLGVSYHRILLVQNNIQWEYESVIHEIIHCIDKQVPRIETLSGDFYIVSGRNGSRNQDPNKYLKDAQILEEAFKWNDKMHSRYAYYCANSYRDAGNSKKAIEWYKITLQQNGWSQEKYMSCLSLYNKLCNINEIEKGLYYLALSFKYDSERLECITLLIQYYLERDMFQIAYQYYKWVEDKLTNMNKKDKLFLQPEIYDFLFPSYMILVANKMNDTKLIKRMFDIIFSKKCQYFNDTFLIKKILHCLQLYIDDFMSKDTLFIASVEDYVHFLKYNSISLPNYSYFHLFENKSFENKCKDSNNILIYIGQTYVQWNHTYYVNHSLGGSETAVIQWANHFPKNFNIYIYGDVLEEQVGNIYYVNESKSPTFINNTIFHTILVSRNIGFYVHYPNAQYYQSFIWAHDDALMYGGSYIKSDVRYKIDGCVCLTNWHMAEYAKKYPELRCKLYKINNGIDTSLFPMTQNKKVNRFIYSSCPSRGLKKILELWNSIVEQMPDAELIVCGYTDFPRNAAEEEMFRIIKSSNSIQFVGHLNKTQLYEYMATAEYWLYPSYIFETSCITAMEMLASNVICLYYPIGGLVDTMSDYGIPLIDGEEVKTIMQLTTKQKQDIRKRGNIYAKELCNWEMRMIQWIDLFSKKEEIMDEFDICVKYGTMEVNLDITQWVVCKDGSLSIPLGDEERALYYTDPLFGVEKSILIMEKKTGTLLKEFKSNEPVVWNGELAKSFIPL
jgi:glycosyltransferase involved in cell wall biosynthesis